MRPPLPAQHTKQLTLLHYPFRSHAWLLAQRDDGNGNGTCLWLGAQCLSAYLAMTLAPQRTRRAVELGSGIGLTPLVLSSLGVDVLATDQRHVCHAVLRQNIARNASNSPPTAGSIQVRELDWSVLPTEWTWDHPSVIASPEIQSNNPPAALHSDARLLGPPFDLILSSDTLYSPDLVTPLLRTLHALSLSSRRSSRFPPVYLCIERRDSALIDSALAEAQSTWGFAVERIPHRKILKAMQKTGINWDRDDWEGVEIWKLVLMKQHTVSEEDSMRQSES